MPISGGGGGATTTSTAEGGLGPADEFLVEHPGEGGAQGLAGHAEGEAVVEGADALLGDHAARRVRRIPIPLGLQLDARLHGVKRVRRE